MSNQQQIEKIGAAQLQKQHIGHHQRYPHTIPASTSKRQRLHDHDDHDNNNLNPNSPLNALDTPVRYQYRIMHHKDLQQDPQDIQDTGKNNQDA